MGVDSKFVGLVTCGNLPGWEKDDLPFHRALDARGIRFEQPIWDDPGVDWSLFDACIIRTTWDYMEKLPAFLRWVARAGHATRLMNPPSVIRWNCEKTYFRDLTAQGVPMAPTLCFEQGASVDLIEIVRERGWSRALLKPVVGLCAWETLRFSDSDEELAAAEAHLKRNLEVQDMLLQPYLRRVETTGEFSAIYIDGRFSHAVQKVPVPGDYRVQDDFGASDHPIDPTPELLEISDHALDAVAQCLDAESSPDFSSSAPLLYARIDCLEDDDGRLLVNEVELIEPSLFFRHSPRASEALADALHRRFSG